MAEDRISSCALAIFAKTPHLSPVKTRLAEDIGVEKATQIYHAMLSCMKDFTHHIAPPVTPLFTIAEEQGVNDAFWKDFRVMHSGEGGLGERLHHSYSTLKSEFDYVILIGSDSPQITPEIISETYDALAHYDHVIGPSFDGGFYLFASKVVLPCSFWLATTYSQHDTLKQMVKYIDSSIYYLPEMYDLDTTDDIQPISSSLLSSDYTFHQMLLKRLDEILFAR